MIRFGAVLLFLFAVGCQVKPTRVSETETRPFGPVMDKLHRPLTLTEATVVLDTRSAFEYGLDHVENALPLTWQALSEDPAAGDVTNDMRKVAQRLALLGLTPKTPVLIVGNGGAEGDEGRLAWTLLDLGFEDVQVAANSVLRKYWTQKPTPPPKNAPAWEAGRRRELEIDHEAFAKLAGDPHTRLTDHIWILDVRSEAEYLGRSVPVAAAPNVGALNFPWTEFYDREGRPQAAAVKKLKALGLKPTDRILCVSQRGVRSGAAAYALIALGFGKVENYLEGWRGYGR